MSLLILTAEINSPRKSDSYEKGYSYDSYTLAPNPKIKTIANEITVKISGAGASGSGVIIKKNASEYTVATAWHVLRGNGQNEEISIITSDGNIHRTYGRNASRVPGIDIASITFTSQKNYKTAKLAATLKGTNIYDPNLEGKPIGVSGFMQDDLTNTYNTGSLVAYAEVGIDSGYELFYTNSTASGISGGPVFNNDGYLIGIHGRGERDQSAIKKYGRPEDTKTAINQGVPISYLINRVESGALSINDPDNYLTIAIKLAKHWGREQIALKMANEVIKIKPSAKAYLSRGFMRKELFDLSGAIKDFQSASNLEPQNDLIKYHLGNTLAEAGKYSEAENALSKVDSLELTNEQKSAVLITRSQIKARTGNNKESIELAREAVELDNSSEAAYLTLTDALKNAENYSEIIRLTGHYKGSPSADLLASKAYAHFKQSQYKSSWQSLNRAIAMHEHFGNIASNARLANPDSQYILRATLNSIQGECINANKDLKTARSINKQNPWIMPTQNLLNDLCKARI